MELCKSFYIGSNPILASTGEGCWMYRPALELGRWFDSTNSVMVELVFLRSSHKAQTQVRILFTLRYGEYSLMVGREIVVLCVAVQFCLFTPKESCLSG